MNNNTREIALQLKPQYMKIFSIVISFSLLASCSDGSPAGINPLPTMSDTTKISLTEEEWKNRLSEEEFRVMRKQGTERAFTGEFWDHHDKGSYTCAGCGEVLFDSDTKFDSGTGWPSYYAPASAGCVEETVDRSHGMIRTEVHCAKCGGHLGHKFDDGPAPTGLRYCINSISLNFKKEGE